MRLNNFCQLHPHTYENMDNNPGPDSTHQILKETVHVPSHPKTLHGLKDTLILGQLQTDKIVFYLGRLRNTMSMVVSAIATSHLFI